LVNGSIYIKNHHSDTETQQCRAGYHQQYPALYTQTWPQPGQLILRPSLNLMQPTGFLQFHVDNNIAVFRQNVNRSLLDEMMIELK